MTEEFFLSPHDLPESARFRARRKLLNHLLSPLMASRRFPCFFRMALRNAALSQEVEQGLFAIPTLWSGRVMKGCLDVDIAPLALQRYAPGYMRQHGEVQPLKWYFVGGGGWDRCGARVQDSLAAAQVAALVRYREDFRTAPIYKEYLERAARGDAYKHRRDYLDSPEKVEAFFARYLGLLTSIEEQGYRPDIKEDKPIGVAIGRDGALLHHRFGHHRIAVAQALKLDRVSARVTFIHQQWLRDVMERNDKPLEIAVADAITTAAAQSFTA